MQRSFCAVNSRSIGHKGPGSEVSQPKIPKKFNGASSSGHMERVSVCVSLPLFWRALSFSGILSPSLVHPSILVHPSVAFPSQPYLFPAHLAPDVLSATTVCPASSEWQNAKSQVTFTWKRLALNSCSPLITLPASAAPCRYRINCLSIRFSHDFD